jgi:hypothetical protein
VDLVDAKPPRRLEARFRLKPGQVLLEDGADGLFVESNLLGDRGEDALDALLADPGQETLGHAPAVGEGRERLEGRPIAILAAEPLCADVEANPLPVGREVTHDLLRTAPLRDLDRAAMAADLHGLRRLNVDVVVVFVFVELQDAILRQIQKAGPGHLRTIGIQRPACESKGS